MDILRVISASDLEVRKKTLNLVLDLVSSRNIEEVRAPTITCNFQWGPAYDNIHVFCIVRWCSC